MRKFYEPHIKQSSSGASFDCANNSYNSWDTIGFVEAFSVAVAVILAATFK